MEGDAFSNRDTESRSGFMSSVGGQTPAGASSPPYRPLDDVPCDTENVPRLLDIKSLQSILAAQVALQAERQERRAATVSDETALTVALSPSSQLRQGELLGFRASIASPNSRYVRELDMSTESGGTSTPGGKGQFVEGSPLKGNQTPDGASSGIPHNSPEKEANESPALVSLILSDDGKVTALPDASASWIGSGGRAAGGEGDNVSTSDWLSSSLPADNLEAPSWRVDPAAVHPTVVLKRSYAWNPWTKTYVPLEQPLRVKHLWCWQLGNINWWTGFLFLIGSVGFFAGAMTGSLRTSHTPEHLPVKIWGELMPYLVGGICFVAGAATFSISSMQQIDRDNKRDNPAYESLLNSREYGFDVTATPAPGAVTWLGVWEVAPAPGEGPLNRPVTLPRRESSGCKQRQRAAAEEEFQRLWREYDPWTRRQHVVEFWGGVAVFLGTLFYKVGLFGDLYHSLGGDIALKWQFTILVGAIQMGSILFLIGGYLLCAAYDQSWFPWRLILMNPRKAPLAWWTVMLNMAGSALFMIGAIPMSVPAPWILAPSVVQNFLGWGIGSLLFFVQSWIMVIEVAITEDDESTEDIEWIIRKP